jgi:hypothetical protein
LHNRFQLKILSFFSELRHDFIESVYFIPFALKVADWMCFFIRFIFQI